MNIKKTAKNILVTVLAPLAVYLFFFAICRLNGSTTFGVGTDLRTILVTTAYTGFISLAMSFNLTSGRFDFSVGSVLILSNIIGYKLGLALELGPWTIALFCIASGMVLGLAAGLAYVLLKLPPMVCSLGVAMIYEALGFIITDGAGVRLVGRNDILIFASAPVAILVGAVLVILIIVLNFTVFGYNTNSLRTGQEISVNVGIDENRNSVWCYVISGGLMACAGLINTSRLGNVSVETGLSSASYLVNAFLPMFIGGALAKYSDRNIGVIIGAFMQSCMISAFGIGKLNFSTHLQTVMSGLTVLIFMFVSNNGYRLSEEKQLRMKKALALAEQNNSI